MLLLIIRSMAKRNAPRRKQKANAKLTRLFKMSREQLETHKTSGAGLHKTRKDIPRSEQKREALRYEMLPVKPIVED